jgi:hypothetical protein
MTWDMTLLRKVISITEVRQDLSSVPATVQLARTLIYHHSRKTIVLVLFSHIQKERISTNDMWADSGHILVKSPFLIVIPSASFVLVFPYSLPGIATSPSSSAASLCLGHF